MLMAPGARWLLLRSFSKQASAIVLEDQTAATPTPVQIRHGKKQKRPSNEDLLYLAPGARFELATNWLTANCATAAPPGNIGDI